MQKSLEQNKLHLKELESAINSLNVGYKNGVAKKSDVDKLRIQKLNILKKNDEILQNIESLQSVFTQFLGVDSKNFNLILPNLNDSKMYLKNAEFIESSFESRPEMRGFTLQIENANIQKKSQFYRGMPYIDAFLQVGVANSQT